MGGHPNSVILQSAQKKKKKNQCEYLCEESDTRTFHFSAVIQLGKERNFYCGDSLCNANKNVMVVWNISLAFDLMVMTDKLLQWNLLRKQNTNVPAYTFDGSR
jgi:uridine kinase